MTAGADTQEGLSKPMPEESLGELRCYRKIPVEVKALQFVNDQSDKYQTRLKDFLETDELPVRFGENGSLELWLETLEGGVWASENDFIVKGVDGELYPCKPDVFRQTYEMV
jgi:hypothetical protein